MLTAEEDHNRSTSDPDLLTRAASLGRLMFSNDADFLTEATRRQRSGECFAGLVYGHQMRITIKQAIEDLELITTVFDLPDIENRVQHLPL